MDNNGIFYVEINSGLGFFSCGNPRYSHMRIHDNDLDLCQYCPYRYEKPSNYTTHLKKHFGIEDFACDHCNKKFPTVTQLNLHHEQHEGIIYYCLICNEYEGQGSTHRLVRGPNVTPVRASLIKPSYEVP